MSQLVIWEGDIPGGYTDRITLDLGKDKASIIQTRTEEGDDEATNGVSLIIVNMTLPALKNLKRVLNGEKVK